MSTLDSWEDENDAEVNNLNKPVRNLNIQNNGSSKPGFNPATFNPGATNFKPGNSFFVPSQVQAQPAAAPRQSAPAPVIAQRQNNAPPQPPASGVRTLNIVNTKPAQPPAEPKEAKSDNTDLPMAANPPVKKPPPSETPSQPSKPPANAQTQQADKVAKEAEKATDQETLQEMFGKEHVNIIFLGHVDAGKSTLGGSILYATGRVDERTLDKLKRDAKEAGRETWYLSWALDLTNEERSKGKTVEVGRGYFETEKRKYSILDAPGHKNFVPSMIGGASQADVGVLVISARKGEYETGFERGGQTTEHAKLAKTMGVNKLIIVVNKMDDPTVEWSEERYNECLAKLTVFLKKIGYNPKTDLAYMPVSAQMNINIKNRVSKEIAPWYKGPSLLEYLDNMKALERKIQAPFMMPVVAKYRDLGTMIEGKIEFGVLRKQNTYIMMPNHEEITISALFGESEEEIDVATCGDQVRLRIKGIEEENVLPGYVLCSPDRPVHCVSKFEAQITLLDLKSILSAGFNCVLHVHCATMEVTFTDLLHKLEKGTGRKSKKPPAFAQRGMSIIARLEVAGGVSNLCIEKYDEYPQLGRFTLRDQGETIAIGKVTKLITDTSS